MRYLLAIGFFLIALACFRRKRRWQRFTGLLLGLLAVFWSIYYDAINNWLNGLGTDSLSEAQNFALSEAFFFIGTIPSILTPNPLLITLSAILVGLFGAWLLDWLVRHVRWTRYHPLRTIASLGLVLICIPVGQQLLSFPKKVESNEALFDRVARNFSHYDDLLQTRKTGHHQLRVIVYIGESTSQLYWNLYGYPLDTTPELNAFAHENEGFFTFSNIVSTHTHTSLSLLQALSFGLPGNQRSRQIYDQKRVPLVSLLKRENIPSMLVSTQSQTGTWAMANAILFDRVDYQEYPNRNFETMDADAPQTRVKDHEAFAHILDKINHTLPQTPAVVFLHSYAGHGPYREAIDDSLIGQHDAFATAADVTQIYGNQVPSADLAFMRDYNDTMRYVDHNLAMVLRDVAADATPTVFIYFADHGESALTQAGHDSSRLQHEMTRVPFFLYFNRAAQEQAPQRFKRWQEAAARNLPGSLEQVPATIMTLLGYAVDGTYPTYAGMGLDPESELPPIVVRQISTGVTYMRSHGMHMRDRRHASDATIAATHMWLNQRAKPGIHLCYDNANTFAKANRGALVSHCLAATLTPGQEGAGEDYLALAPADGNSSPWALDTLAQIASARQRDLWLDARDWSATTACHAIHRWRKAFAERHTQPLPSLVIALDTQRVALSPACEALQHAAHVRLYQHVPEDLLDKPRNAQRWQAAQAERGWPPHYLLANTVQTDVLKALLQADDSRWAVSGIDISQLPWQGPEDDTLKPPEFVHVTTQWDINTRKDTALLKQIQIDTDALP